MDIISSKFKQDRNGIYVSNRRQQEITKTINVWNEIYDFDISDLDTMHREFNRDKLNDLLKNINVSNYKDKPFVYLEIGCGPSYLGKYMLDNFNCTFVGVDLNYKALVILKEFFQKYNIDKQRYILILSDIRHIPLRNESIDIIYGGGVIEHVPDTENVILELYRVLKGNGISINTVPALNLFWGLRFYMSIPNIRYVRNVFEYFHIKIAKEKLLSRFYGYELSFTKNKLSRIHTDAGFKKITCTPFAFHPNKNKISNKILYEIYYLLSSNSLTCAFYLITAKKNNAD